MPPDAKRRPVVPGRRSADGVGADSTIHRRCDEDRLFDVAPLTVGVPREARRAKPQPPATEVVPLIVDDDRRWCIVVAKAHGIVHYLDVVVGTMHRSLCGKIGAPMTYGAGEIVMGCKLCVDCGAPARRAEQ